MFHYPEHKGPRANPIYMGKTSRSSTTHYAISKSEGFRLPLEILFWHCSGLKTSEISSSFGDSIVFVIAEEPLLCQGGRWQLVLNISLLQLCQLGFLQLPSSARTIRSFSRELGCRAGWVETQHNFHPMPGCFSTRKNSAIRYFLPIFTS